MKVLELFAGTGGVSDEFKARGFETFTVDWDESFDCDLHCDIGTLTAEEIIEKFGKPDVIFAAPECFTKDVLVYTNQGYKNINEINVGDLVLTHKGNYKKVTNVIKKKANEMMRLKISGCEEVLVTPNHPYYARKKVEFNTHKDGKPYFGTRLEDPEWINAEDLTSEYRVGIPINSNAVIPKWDGVVYNTNSINGYKKGDTKNELSKYLNTEEFWWLVGRYFGDGHLSKKDSAIDVTVGKQDIDGILKIKETMTFLNIKPYEREQRTAKHFCFYDKEFHTFLSQFGFGAKEKHINNTILDLPKNLIKAFCEGYISADGHWDYSLKNPVCSVTTISRKLAYGMQQCILKAFDRYCSLIKRSYENNNIIEGRKVNVNPSYTIGFYKNKTNRLQYTIEDGYAWVNVRKNTKEEMIEDVYTLSVEDDESFTVNNIICHNCTTYSLAAISKHRKKNSETGNLDPISEYAKKCDEVNRHLLKLINDLRPKLWFIENPRACLQNMTWMKPLDKYKYLITYCQYQLSDPIEKRRMKPTNLWTNHPDPQFKPPCKNGDPCHMAAPRGSRTGTQGMKNAKERSTYPKNLIKHIVDISESYLLDEIKE